MSLQPSGNPPRRHSSCRPASRPNARGISAESPRVGLRTGQYPRSFWVLFFGTLVNTAGASVVWPFLTIYLRQRFNVPLTTVAFLLTLNSIVGFVATALAGPVVDRLGRKAVMVTSLLASGAASAAMTASATLPLWVLLMAANGAAAMLYRVGADAMVADLVEPEKRTEAYALLRTMSNLGVAIGPAIGGFVTLISYALAFQIAAITHAAFALLLVWFVGETMHKQPKPAADPGVETSEGYARLLHDRPFLAFCGAYTLAGMAYTVLMVLLPVYAKEHFAVPENQYGFIMATNATMVVAFQYAVTRITKRYPYLPVLAAGSLFYAVGVGSVAFGSNFPTFLTSMVVLTIGEMVMVPTAMALTATLAPPEMRGRYMSIYGLTWTIGMGSGPLAGGILHDAIAPVAIWYGGMLMALVAALAFVVIARAPWELPSNAV